MTSLLRRLNGMGLVGGLTLLLLGCATSDFAPSQVLRAASATPDHFLVGSFTAAELSEPIPGAGARSPMVDPRDGTRLTLVRSANGQGDYAVPADHYGVRDNELLRLDGATGRAVGIVRR